MDANDPCKLEMDALIEAIWGPDAVECPTPLDPETRSRQNQALATAMKAYLQTYLDEARPPLQG